MRAFVKRYSLAVASGGFLACLAFVAYAHMRYVRAESVYLNHLGTITFRPHINVLTGLSSYEAAASRWLALQAIGTGLALMASIVMIVLVWRRRTSRLRADELGAEAAAE